jgi:hypothetical protein
MLLAVVIAVASSALAGVSNYERALLAPMLSEAAEPPKPPRIRNKLLVRDHMSSVTPHDQHMPKPVSLTSIESSMPWFDLTYLPSGVHGLIGDHTSEALYATR